MYKFFSLIEKIIGRIRKPFWLKINNINNGYLGLTKRCLLYYKTEPFYRNINNLKINHGNNQEIIEMVRVLNENGYLVDVIDRELESFAPNDEYDLFLGNASGNSGRKYLEYASRLKKAKKIIYATGPEPSMSNALVKERYDDFFSRTNIKVAYCRVSDIPFGAFVNISDGIFIIGEKELFSHSSYKELFQIPIYNVTPISNPNIEFQDEWISKRNKKSFLCFAGSGAICKGVDILIEVFKDLPEYQLHICSPDDEDMKAIKRAYNGSIGKNIVYHGYVVPGSSKYNFLMKECAYTLLNSAAEGCCGSVVNGMKSGLVPIVNFECGLHPIDDQSLIFSGPDRIQNTRNAVVEMGKVSKIQYQKNVYAALALSNKFSLEQFSKSFEQSLKNAGL